jgi:hypothetical protein
MGWLGPINSSWQIEHLTCVNEIRVTDLGIGLEELLGRHTMLTGDPCQGVAGFHHVLVSLRLMMV